MAISRPELYKSLISQLSALLEQERDLIANAANTAWLILHTLPELNFDADDQAPAWKG